MRFGGWGRGRPISASDRRKAVELISESVDSGAALYKASEELGISKRTYNRWKETDSDYIDKRTTCAHPEPVNKLTKKEKILEIVKSEEFASKALSEIVPILADRGKYIASESSLYEVLREAEELKHRGRSKVPISKRVATHKAIKSKQVWMWDII